jgi:hypothetical protein
MSGVRTEILEGAVQRVGERALWFREEGAAHDICIPLSQIENAESVAVGDLQVEVSKWLLNRLEEEGKR